MGFSIVLFEPLIPQNTGNIGRLCVATRSSLHLIEPLGFDISEKAVRRAGLDYWRDIDLKVHKNWNAFTDFLGTEKTATTPKLWFFSKYGEKSIYDAKFSEGDYLVFGKETTGLKDSGLETDATRDQFLRIPMPGEDKVRCLNLAGSAHVAVYEALRQVKFGRHPL